MASYAAEDLEHVFLKRRGRCHLCGDRVRFEHYGRTSRRGWEIDHDHPLALGGEHHLDNLEPAHATCNRSKQAMPSEVFRSLLGLERPPLSADELEELAVSRLADGVLVGTAIGALLGAPRNQPGAGALIGAFVGIALATFAAPSFDDDI
jgi:hypothetical protein